MLMDFHGWFSDCHPYFDKTVQESIWNEDFKGLESEISSVTLPDQVENGCSLRALLFLNSNIMRSGIMQFYVILRLIKESRNTTVTVRMLRVRNLKSNYL